MNSTALTTLQVDFNDTNWVVNTTAFMFLMIPGVAFFYRGQLAYSKNKLSILFTSLAAFTVVFIQWFLFGYSLCFADEANHVIGSFTNALLIGVGETPHSVAPTIPEYAFMLNQGVMASIAPIIIFGSAAERASLRVNLIFIFLWTTLVYDPLTYWVLGTNGWLKSLIEVIDYGGGTPVHIGGGFSALAYCLVLGPREDFKSKKHHPIDISEVYWGTVLLLFGWFGFNGSSEFAINVRTVNAITNTYVAACSAAVTWILTEMLFNRTKKMSLYGLCSGLITGCSIITPSCGFISPGSSVAIGAIGGCVCCIISLKKRLIKRFDDVCDVFAIHGIGGALGGILTGIFADNTVFAHVPVHHHTIKGGWFNDNYIQILRQLLSVVVSAAWSFVFTLIILLLINLIPFCKIRVNKVGEDTGIDYHEMGEYAYGHDIIMIDEESNACNNVVNKENVSQEKEKSNITTSELNVGDEKSENEKKSKHNLTKTEIIELEKRHHEQQYVKEIMYITDLE